MNSSVIVDRLVTLGVLFDEEIPRSRRMPDVLRDPERVLSRPPGPEDPKNRNGKRSPRAQVIEKTLLFAAIVICGIAAVIGWRELGALFGVLWLGD